MTKGGRGGVGWGWGWGLISTPCPLPIVEQPADLAAQDLLVILQRLTGLLVKDSVYLQHSRMIKFANSVFKDVEVTAAPQANSAIEQQRSISDGLGSTLEFFYALCRHIPRRHAVCPWKTAPGSHPPLGIPCCIA